MLSRELWLKLLVAHGSFGPWWGCQEPAYLRSPEWKLQPLVCQPPPALALADEV